MRRRTWPARESREGSRGGDGGQNSSSHNRVGSCQDIDAEDEYAKHTTRVSQT